MTWRPVHSLTVLFGQVDAEASHRSKASDGTEASPAHDAANPTSAHHPHYVPGIGDDIVTAGDITHDPAGGCDTYALAETLRANRDARIKYVISNRRIFSAYAVGSHAPFEWRDYTGTDPHTNHVHVETVENATADGTQLWNLKGWAMDLDEAVTTGRTVRQVLAAVDARTNLLANTSGLVSSVNSMVSQLGAMGAHIDTILAAVANPDDPTHQLPDGVAASLAEIRDNLTKIPEQTLAALKDAL
jgi:hypothetical protein